MPKAPPVRHEPAAEKKPPDSSNRSLLASTGSIAIATLISRITGFLKQMLLLTVLGGAVASSFTVASQIPNMISELVLGAVLTAIVVPVLVRAEKDDLDGGAGFTRRLVTSAVLLLGAAALLATAAAPLLTTHVFLSDDGQVDTELTTALSFLLLPAILFYGMTALLTAILNTRQDFKPGAWAPVLNNIVVISVLGIYLLVPGDNDLNPVRMSDPKLLVLGGGVTLGVIVQALSLVPAIRRQHIDLRPLFGIDARLKQFGGMALAIIVYVLISQSGFIFATRISSHADKAGPAIYNNAWLLLQLPYGVLGVTVLTAIMPRLSRNAAANDTPAVVDDLAIATRLTMIALIPVITLLTFAGPEVGHALYGYGNFGEGDAARLGHAVSWSAFTLIPYAMVLIHLRVFYAREQAWTPTWIILGITAVKIALSALAPVVADSDEQVVSYLGVANGLGFFTGAVIGGLLLRRQLGHLEMRSVAKTVWLVLVASLAGAGVMKLADWGLHLDNLSARFGGPGSGIRVAIGGMLMAVTTFTILRVAKVEEIVAITVALRRRLGGGNDDVAPEPAHDPFMDAQTMVIPVIRANAVDITGLGEFPYPVRQRAGAKPYGGQSWGHTREGVRMSDDSIAGAPAGGYAADASEPTRTGQSTGGVSTDTVRTDTSAEKPDAGPGNGPTAPVSTGARPPAPRPPAAATGRPPVAPKPEDQDATRQTPVTAKPIPAPQSDGQARQPRGPKLIPGASVAGGRYRLLQPHGGARGLTFWQARDTKLDREVALTFVDAEQTARPDDTGPDGPQAILSRTLRLGRVNSPGLARVLDVVRGSSGGIVVAEWTAGRSLQEMAKTTPSPVGAARAIRALASAAELTHRGGGALSIDHPDRIRISVAGDAVLAFPGTLADADAQSDVRGLGAMLYALITAKWPLGKAPGGVTGTAISAPTVGGLPLAEHGPDGAPIEPRELRPEVPFEISAVAVRALETNRGVRTAATVQHVLDQATVVDVKTDLMPALRLGQRAPGATGHALADPEEVEAQKARSQRTMLMIAGLGGLMIVLLATMGWFLASCVAGPTSDDSLADQIAGLGGEPSTSAAPAAGTPAPAPGVPVEITSVAEFSPEGTPDNPTQARNVNDRKADTVWRTSEYTQNFPNGTKDGIGLIATLPDAVKLEQVWINSPSSGVKVEIRYTDDPTPTYADTEEIATAELQPGVTEIPINSDTKTRYVLVWISGLGKNRTNQYEAVIADLGIQAAP
ncbi:murein biosynthesis integral membrane protein MurJ [Antrihabitans sp. YC2-6]|uniref:murein biosynthesis integral membrane protein MurJ n=1 Tax=Antrihabitans sp. YC2-6 TaxID=2799498 RepID=UPI001F1CE451|nr:murein biosynthesis integral membrane protein MurJ [Antrihabitans sp. YC2-6]